MPASPLVPLYPCKHPVSDQKHAVQMDTGIAKCVDMPDCTNGGVVLQPAV